MKSCDKCNFECNPEEEIVCDTCCKSFHYSCIDADPQAKEDSPKGMTWKCPICLEKGTTNYSAAPNYELSSNVMKYFAEQSEKHTHFVEKRISESSKQMSADIKTLQMEIYVLKRSLEFIFKEYDNHRKVLDDYESKFEDLKYENDCLKKTISDLEEEIKADKKKEKIVTFDFSENPRESLSCLVSFLAAQLTEDSDMNVNNTIMFPFLRGKFNAEWANIEKKLPLDMNSSNLHFSDWFSDKAISLLRNSNFLGNNVSFVDQSFIKSEPIEKVWIEKQF